MELVLRSFHYAGICVFWFDHFFQSAYYETDFSCVVVVVVQYTLVDLVSSEVIPQKSTPLYYTMIYTTDITLTLLIGKMSREFPVSQH